jgi:chromosome partitioning protein
MTAVLEKTKKSRASGARKPSAASNPDPIPPEKGHKRLLLVASSKGGSGKTVSAINLAVNATHAGLRVATVDLDRQETLTRWIAVRPPEAPEIVHFKIPVDQIGVGMRDIENAEDVDLFIVDTPPGIEDHPEAVRLLMQRADFCLVPTGQGISDLDSVIEWNRLLKREKVRSAFLLNRTKRNAKSFERAKIRLVKEGSLCPFDVRDLEDITNLGVYGVGVLEIRGSRGFDDCEGVWTYVRGQLGI